MKKRIQCIVICLAFIISSIFVSAESTDDLGFNLDDFFLDSPTVEISNDTPNLSDMTLVGENDRLQLYFYESGLDVFVIDKLSGKLWSNVITNEYSHADISPNIASQLITVSVSSKDSQNSYTLYDSSNKDISATVKIFDKKVLLGVKVKDSQISFDVEIGLTDDGFYYLIPEKSIVESKNSKIINISLFDNFGASRTDEKGYIFYPDGCGSIINFKPWDEENAILHQDTIYGSTGLNYLNMERNSDYNINGVLLPVFGISQENSGFVAVTNGGESDSAVNLSLPGYQVSGIYRAFFSHNYRYYSDTLFNGTNVTSLVKERVHSDRKVQYFLLSGESNNYSGMANRVRKYFIDSKIISKKVSVDKMPITTEILCAVQKKGMLNSSLSQMTTFDQAESIIKEINSFGNINLDVTLSGWGKGGWDTLPTKLSAESQLGGKRKLNKLGKFCKSNNIDISLVVDPILANSDTGDFNINKNTVKNYFGEPYSDKSEKKYVLSAQKVMNKTVTDFNKSFDLFGINLHTVGKMLSPDYNNKDSVTRTEMMNAYVSALSKLKQPISITDGNAYALKYANKIYEVPSNNSGYVYMDETVPFWQIVFHGYKLYTGQFSNTYYDMNEYILKTIETGSVPSFIVTNENTGKLLKSDYTKVFSTEFKSVKSTMLEITDKLSKDITSLYSKQILRHEILDEDFVRVTYENGVVVYINYSDKEKSFDSFTVKATDYLLVKG